MTTLIASPVSPGEVFAGKYRVERIVGQGGMGVVVAARHLELDQTVAIKFLVRDAPVNALERFMREAKAAALVKSEHACRVHDFGRLESGEPYIVMEYLEGTDLADKLDGEGPQPVADTVGWIIQACDALSNAHAQGIVHRDLKPANLFLQQSADGPTTLKVVDFGISKLATSAALTSTAVLMGSPLYMSPEQLESSRDVDPRSDIWSLGVVLYELLTGDPPFVGETLVQIVVQAREHQPVPVNRLRPEVPRELARVVERCLAKDPAARYPNVNALVVDLAPFAGPDSSAIIQKLSKRAGRSSDPKLVLSKTVETDPVALARASQKTRNDTPNARGAAGQGPAFARAMPTDVELAPELEPTGPRERRRRLRTPMTMLGVALGVLTILAVALILRRRPLPDVPRPIPEPTTLSSTALDSSTVAATDAAGAAIGVASVAQGVPASASVRASVEPLPTRTVRPGGRTTSAPNAHPSAPPVVVVVPSATASAGPKRRDVDRDYQP